jgi:threonine aldolase
MANEICIKCQTQPGDEVICDSGAHILNYESGAAALLSSVQLHPLQGDRGVLDIAETESAIQPDLYHFPKTTLIAIENTHNSAGGTIYPLSAIRKLSDLARERGVKLHLDGARLWNACIASGVVPGEYARFCDSVSVCFSKGLGAPVGSAVIGSSDFIERARKVRKIFGGGMRQVGILAAAALYALENNFQRLQEDHDKAKRLAENLAELPSVGLDNLSVQTNIVIFDVKHPAKSPASILQELQSLGLLLVSFGQSRLRAVTHLDVSTQQIGEACDILKKVLT